MDIQILLALQSLREAIGGCLNGFFTFLTMIAVDYYIMLPGLILFWAFDKRAGAIGLCRLFLLQFALVISAKRRYNIGESGKRICV